MTARLLSAITTLAVVTACGSDEDNNQDPEGAKRLYAQIREQDYRAWMRAPGYETRRTSSAPHGDQVDIYVNDVVSAVLAAAEPASAWPVGSTIAKDGWNGATLHIVAIMEKRNGGWFWAELDAGGQPEYSGRPGICVDCHSEGSDHVRAFELPK